VAIGRRGGVSGSGDAADRIKQDEIRSTRHVYRQTGVGHEVILLCNSAGTAVAVESEISDAALISALRAVPPTRAGHEVLLDAITGADRELYGQACAGWASCPFASSAPFTAKLRPSRLDSIIDHYLKE
jgi:hypothetical protein